MLGMVGAGMAGASAYKNQALNKRSKCNNTKMHEQLLYLIIIFKLRSTHPLLYKLATKKYGNIPDLITRPTRLLGVWPTLGYAICWGAGCCPNA
jgi:hypothetical protein